jgi:hypothetical protein
VNITVRGARSVTAKPDAADQKGVSSSEHASYVVHAPDILQQNDHGKFFGVPELFNRFSVQITCLFDFQGSTVCIR